MLIIDRMMGLRRVSSQPLVQRKNSFLQLEDGTQLLYLSSDPLQPVQDPQIQIGVPMPQISCELGAERSGLFRLLNAWLADCDLHHKCLLKPLKNTFSPTRLIHTGSQGSTVRITTQSCSDYIVLSHCWGQLTNVEKACFCTTQENYSKRLQGFELADLPQTFQDAVVVTRKLGKQYLWIDSVCLYVDRYQRKYHRNLRFGPLFSEGFHFALEGMVGANRPRHSTAQVTGVGTPKT
jgi:hypothetical protein